MNPCLDYYPILFFTSTSIFLYLNLNFELVHSKNVKLKSKSTIYLSIFSKVSYSQEIAKKIVDLFTGSLEFYEQVVCHNDVS